MNTCSHHIFKSDRKDFMTREMIDTENISLDEIGD